LGAEKAEILKMEALFFYALEMENFEKLRFLSIFLAYAYIGLKARKKIVDFFSRYSFWIYFTWVGASPRAQKIQKSATRNSINLAHIAVRQTKPS